MFGAQLNLGDNYKWYDDLNDPTSDRYKSYANATTTMIIASLKPTPSGKLMLISSDVTYNVQVTRFTPDAMGIGTWAYTSGVALSTGDDIPTVPDIRDQLEETLGESLGDDSVKVNEPSAECPICPDFPPVTTSDCPAVTAIPTTATTPTDCPGCDCTPCPAEVTTECPSLSSSTPIPFACPNMTTVIPTVCPDCSSCPMVTTECPLIPCPSSSLLSTCPPMECPTATECPSTVATECPSVIPTDCPVCTTPAEVITTECPSHINTTPTECPTVIPTDCPLCPDCPSLTCPTNSPDGPTESASDCPTLVPTDFPPQDCSQCPTECPSSSSPIPSQCPSATEFPTLSTAECPTLIPTDCPVCSTCPAETTECPATPCPTVSSTEYPNPTSCPTVLPTDCPVCPSEGTSTECPTLSCPTSTTECPSTECPSSTGYSSTIAPDCPQTCHSTMFGAQVSLVDPWDSALENTDSDEFKALSDTTSKMIIAALEGASSGMAILASSDGTVTYDVQVSRFIADEKGGNTIAFTSGVALSTAEDMPSVDQIREKMDATLGDDSVTVKNNELEFCPNLPPPHTTTPSSWTTSQESEIIPSTTTVPQSTTHEEYTQSTTIVTESTTQEPDTTHSTTPTLQSTTQEAQSTTPFLRTTTEQQENPQSSTPVSPSTSIEPESTQSVTQPTTQEHETPNTSTPVPPSSSFEPETTQSTTEGAQSTSQEPETLKSSTPVPPSTSIEPDTTQSTTEGAQSTTTQEDILKSSTTVYQSTTSEAQHSQSTTPLQTTTDENPQSSTTVAQSTSLEPGRTQSTTEVAQSTTTEQENPKSSTSVPQSTSSEPETTQSPAVSQTTTHEVISTDGSSPTPEDHSTTAVSESSTARETQSTTAEPTGSSPSFPPSTESLSTITTAPTEADISTTIPWESSTSEGPVNTSTPSDSSSTEAASSSTAPPSTSPSQTTTEQQTTVLTTESFSTLPSTLPSTSEVWSSPSTVACSGREVIKGDVYLLFDYTLHDHLPDETMAIEAFITEILFSFDGNDFFLGRDPTGGDIPLRLYLVHYPTVDDQYSQFFTSSISNLTQLSYFISLVNEIPLTSTESKMKEALEAIYNSSPTPVNPPSIILISKSDEYVEEAIPIATQLKSDKKFTIIGVPLNGADLTRLTSVADVPLDVNSMNSQVETATQIDSILKSISSYCLTSIPTLSTSRYTTPSTTTKVPTTPSSCASSLDDQSIAFVYQLNYEEAARNSEIVSEFLGRPEVEGTGASSFGALFPFPNTDSYPQTAVHSWLLLNDPRWPIFFTLLVPQPSATSANIADGLQSLIDYPGPNHQIVVIIANSDDGVTSAVTLADQLKDSSTIITLSYGGDFDLSPLASSDQFTLTQSTEEPSQAATLLLNSILQATCQ